MPTDNLEFQRNPLVDDQYMPQGPVTSPDCFAHNRKPWMGLNEPPCTCRLTIKKPPLKFDVKVWEDALEESVMNETARKLPIQPDPRDMQIHALGELMKSIRDKVDVLEKRTDFWDDRFHERIEKLEQKLENFLQHTYVDDYAEHTRAINHQAGRNTGIMARIKLLESPQKCNSEKDGAVGAMTQPTLKAESAAAIEKTCPTCDGRGFIWGTKND